MKLWFDCETFSECELKVHGTHRYAEHPSTEITVVQWAIDDGNPYVHDCTEPGWKAGMPGAMFAALKRPDVTVIAHNSHFDRTLVRHCWGIDVPVERWYDTMVQGMSHGLPGSLDRMGQVLGHAPDVAKDKRGRDLIQLFSKPRPKGHKLRRATRETHPKEWADFLGYSRQDIIAMRAVSRDLPTWNYKPGHPELALWHLDQKINDRGFRVDLGLAQGAIEAVAREQARLKQEVQEATAGAVSSPSKRDALLVYILAEYGVTLPDMAADTLRRRLEDPELPEGVKLLLSLRLEAVKTSTAKYKALANATSADGRLRNTLQFAGAQRTARWAGRVFQPQNLPRPTPDFTEDEQEFTVDCLKHGVSHLVIPNVMQATSNAVRGCIVAPPGRKLVVADLANIEGRGLAFLAGENWKLKAFADFDKGTGADMYKLAYARSFNCSPDDVSKAQRQIGKVQELGLGYEGGVAAFITFAAVYNMDLDEMANAVWATASREALEAAQGMLKWTKKKGRSTSGLIDRTYIACEVLKAAWREAHPNTKALWAAAKEGVALAIGNPGQSFKIGQHLIARRDGAWLRIRLPSGRYLCYLQPKVEGEQISYMGVDQYTRQWKRVKTYGGKIVENCTQAFARDIMAHNMQFIEDSGYAIVLSVHDELPTEAPDDPKFNAGDLSARLARRPPWALGIPLAAAGFECYRYRKE
jgi:DNA polymerase